jgi:hypothetical protein
MSVLDDYRAKYPQYQDVPDGKLAAAIRQKYYSDMPAPDFYRKTGLEHLVGLSDAPETGLGSNVGNYIAAIGKTFVDNARGAGQMAADLGTSAKAGPDARKRLVCAAHEYQGWHRR